MWAIREEENPYREAKLRVALARSVKRVEGEEKRQPYAAIALKIWNDYEETVFNLSEQSPNETVGSIKAMNLGQRKKLEQLIVERSRRKKNGKAI